MSRAQPWWTCGLVWTAGIFAVEAATGAAIKKATGEVPWDYARARGVRPVRLHDTLVPPKS